MNPSRSSHAVSAALSATVAAAALLLASASAEAVTVTDPANDFLPTFGGSTASADLDVLSASVTYDENIDSFILSATMNGPIGATKTGFYVWGVNTGSGTAGFAANGLPDILFDRVVLLNSPAGNIVPGSGALPSGAVTISGNTITAVVDEDLLPSTGFAVDAYTWNLWPRDAAVPAGFSQISDFAPDTHDFGNIAAVPEPETYTLMLAGLGAIGWRGFGRRRNR